MGLYGHENQSFVLRGYSKRGSLAARRWWAGEEGLLACLLSSVPGLQAPLDGDPPALSRSMPEMGPFTSPGVHGFGSTYRLDDGLWRMEGS